jgi:type IV pilus assembly protein PilB
MARVSRTSQTRLGEHLIPLGKIEEAQLQDALALHKEQGGRIGTSLVKLGHLNQRDLTEALSQHFGVPAGDRGAMDVEVAGHKVIPPHNARQYTNLPGANAGATVTLAMIDPTNLIAKDDGKVMSGDRGEPVVAAE